MSVKKATIKEIEREMVTYGFSDPNPIAVPDRIYPYFRFDGYAAQGSPEMWKMVVMENEYIKLFITPDIGGKIWGAIEKSTGHEFIYFNHVVKFRDVAMRGPWTSGGLEMNFGTIGHAPTCATPVDYYLRENEDGSASCFVGALDLRSRTRWTVEVRLPAASASFMTRSFWYNPTRLEQPYYHWMNVGVKTRSNLEYIYPGSHHLGHDGSVHAWPLDEKGRDLSFYEKNNFGGYKSYHIIGSPTDFFGGYWHEDDFGFGHYAPYDELPGKKIWIWGSSQQGAIWEDLLTDADGQYTEIQSGRLFNQGTASSSGTPFKHRAFPPGGSDTWAECWFPVKGTKGMVAATMAGSVNVISDNGKTRILYCANSKVNGVIEIRTENSVLLREQIILEPMEVWEGTFDSSEKGGDIEVWLDGDRLLYDTKGDVSYIDRPVKLSAAFNPLSAYGLYLSGKEWERQGYYDRALDQLEKCLQSDSGFMPAMTGLAGLYVRSMEYEKALQLAKESLSIDAYDPEANFIYGVVSEKIGHTANALDGYAIASASAAYRSASYSAMAEIFFKKKEFRKCRDYARKSLNYNRWSPEANQIKAVSLRLEGRKTEASTLIAEMEREDPLNHFIRCEQYFLEKTSHNKEQFLSLIRNEFTTESFLELAIWYYGKNLLMEALEVLILAPSHPIVLYWSAYVYDRTGDEKMAKITLQKANEAEPMLIFPFRFESLKPLHWALQHSSHWTIHYYAGLIYLKAGRVEKALTYLQSCYEQPDFYPFYLTRAELLKATDPGQAKVDITKALSLAPDSFRVGLAASKLYVKFQELDKALELAGKFFQKYPQNYYLGLQLAKLLNLSENFEDCIDLLINLNVLPNEGATDGRDLWREANVAMAIWKIKAARPQDALAYLESAREWPLNLGVGKPFDTDERLENFITTNCFEALEKTAEAIKICRGIAGVATQQDYKPANSGDFISAWCLRKSGQLAEADKIMKVLLDRHPEEKNIRWCWAIYHGDVRKARTISMEPDETVEVMPYEEPKVDHSFPLLVRLQHAIQIFSRGGSEFE